MSDEVVCMFPHSKDEFVNFDDLRHWLVGDLFEKEKGRYLLKKLGYRDKGFIEKVIPESLVLFRMRRTRDIIVGEGVVEKCIEKYDPPIHGFTGTGKPMDYHYGIKFKPKSICLYDLPVSDLKEWSGRSFLRGYVILGSRQVFEQVFSSRRLST